MTMDMSVLGTVPPIAIASPPFPWATNRVAIHHPIAHLSAIGITAVDGEVQCRRCDARKTISYDIAAKFQEVRDFVSRNVRDMNGRAPDEWLFPAFPDCDVCGQRRCLRPVMPVEKERINWVFLLLGQMLGCCTLAQLKYFCAHTGQRSIGAKGRVLYSTFMELCNQLCPDDLFTSSQPVADPASLLPGQLPGLPRVVYLYYDYMSEEPMLRISDQDQEEAGTSSS